MMNQHENHGPQRKDSSLACVPEINIKKINYLPNLQTGAINHYSKKEGYTEKSM